MSETVKPGYKQTEVGVIPEEWEAGSLGRFWSVTDCKHVTAQFVPQGIPLASIREVQSRFVELTNAKQTTAYYYNLLIEGGRKPCPGDLILSRNATVGEVAQVAEWHPPFAMGQDVCLLRKKAPDHSTDFLQAVFQSPVILDQLSNLMVGSTFKRANVEQIRNFAVPMPSPAEQRAIATALSDVDALLAALDRLIAKQGDLKQAAMQQLLTGQTRLPGFEGCSTFKQTEVGLIPEDWRVESVGVISTVGRGRVISHREIALAAAPLYPVYSSQTSDNGIMGYLDTFQFDGEYITWTTDGANAGTVFHRNGRFNCTNVCGTIKLKTDNAGFVSRVLAGITPPHVSRNLGNPKLMNDVMKRISIPLPPLPEQTAIATVLADMDLELAAMEQRRDKTRALKQGMMQELLTGRTRLI